MKIDIHEIRQLVYGLKHVLLRLRIERGVDWSHTRVEHSRYRRLIVQFILWGAGVGLKEGPLSCDEIDHGILLGENWWLLLVDTLPERLKIIVCSCPFMFFFATKGQTFERDHRLWVLIVQCLLILLCRFEWNFEDILNYIFQSRMIQQHLGLLLNLVIL